MTPKNTDSFKISSGLLRYESCLKKNTETLNFLPVMIEKLPRANAIPWTVSSGDR